LSFVIDPKLADQSRDTTPDDQMNESSHLWYFQQCSDNRELLKSVEVVIPVRPEDGMSCDLARMVSIWYGEGTAWSQLNDNCGGFIEMTRANIAYDFVHRKRPVEPKYLLMIDNDMVPPINLPYMLAHHGLPVVGGVAVSMHDKGPRACFTAMCKDGEYRFPEMRKHILPSKGLIKAGHVGTGALLIRRDVLESFSFEGSDIPFYVPESIRQTGARVGRLIMGEDLIFSEQCREKGFEVYVDAEARLGHLKRLKMEWVKEKTSDTLVAENFIMEPYKGVPVRK